MGFVKPQPVAFAKVKVIGVGGGGGNIVNWIAKNTEVEGVELIAINTDLQALSVSSAPIKLQIGEKLTRGLGAGGDPKVGRAAAEESREKIKDVLVGADMVFITGGEGGGTCSGAAPVIAQIAKEELGILTVAIVTKPFVFEGTRRAVVAQKGLEELSRAVDTLVVIPNQKLLVGEYRTLSLMDAFALVDKVVAESVGGLTELITKPGLINVDFADIRAIMQNGGMALMGVGVGEGEARVQKAVTQIVNSPLSEAKIQGARGVLFHLDGGQDLKMEEVELAANEIAKHAGGDANIIFGVSVQPEKKGQVRLTLVATGVEKTTGLTGLLPEFQKNKKGEGKIAKNKKKREETAPEVAQFTQKYPLPKGVKIEDPLDIPAFLRRNK